jgi:hypothetical protein
LIIDAHCHVIVEEMTAPAVPENWRPVVTRPGRRYSVGEVAAAAVTATKSLDNFKIIKYLHSGVTLQTVPGPAKFSNSGENVVAQKFIFQWQNGPKFVQVLPASATGSVPIVNPKPTWGS